MAFSAVGLDGVSSKVSFHSFNENNLKLAIGAAKTHIAQTRVQMAELTSRIQIEL